MNSHNKQPIGLEQSEQNQMGTSLTALPIILEEAIADWGARMRKKVGNHFATYHELSHLTGRAVPTLRAYTYVDTPTYPPVDVLAAICRAINDWRPVEYYFNYVEGLK